ncbi:MAG: hypothetical protein HQ575_03820 [Candidatus Omnitrophica bacterium]|nr:hypothetical protein [Candidatus Omnitrophota bacterium]
MLKEIIPGIFHDPEVDCFLNSDGEILVGQNNFVKAYGKTVQKRQYIKTKANEILKSLEAIAGDSHPEDFLDDGIKKEKPDSLSAEVINEFHRKARDIEEKPLRGVDGFVRRSKNEYAKRRLQKQIEAGVLLPNKPYISLEKAASFIDSECSSLVFKQLIESDEDLEIELKKPGEWFFYTKSIASAKGKIRLLLGYSGLDRRHDENIDFREGRSSLTSSTHMPARRQSKNWKPKKINKSIYEKFSIYKNPLLNDLIKMGNLKIKKSS